MISIDETKEIIRNHRLPRQTESVPVIDSQGKHLARKVTAPFNAPRFDNSAMDGCVVRWSDIASVDTSSKITLDIADESKAGSPWDGTLQTGEAIQINTDAVVPVEHCQTFEGRNRITVTQTMRKGNHIRRQGKEYRQGDHLLAKSTELNPATGGLLPLAACQIAIFA